MVDLDVIMGMDWIASFYANINCQTKVDKFYFLGDPTIVWKGNPTMPKGG